jgi:hypothetical protein
MTQQQSNDYTERSLVKSVQIVIRGAEETRVIDKESKQSYDAACILHESSMPLPGFISKSGTLRIGTYTLPFKLPIDDDLPQTITIPWTHISYWILCCLEDNDGNMKEQARVGVNILAKPKSCPNPTPFHMDPFVHYVKKNILQRGHFVITLTIEDTTLELGGKVGVAMVIRNRSPLLIRRVKIVLKQNVHATAVHQEREGERMLTFYEFREFRKTKRMRGKWLRGVKPEEDFEEILQELQNSQDDEEEQQQPKHHGSLRIPKVRETRKINHNYPYECMINFDIQLIIQSQKVVSVTVYNAYLSRSAFRCQPFVAHSYTDRCR